MLNLVRGGPSPRYKLAGTRQGSRRTWARSVSFAWRSLPCSIETAILFATCSEWGFSSRSYGGKPAHLSSRERSDLRPLAGESLLLSLASEAGSHTPPHLHFAKERHSWLEFGSSSLQVGQKQFDGTLLTLHHFVHHHFAPLVAVITRCTGAYPVNVMSIT